MTYLRRDLVYVSDLSASNALGHGRCPGLSRTYSNHTRTVPDWACLVNRGHNCLEPISCAQPYGADPGRRSTLQEVLESAPNTKSARQRRPRASWHQWWPIHAPTAKQRQLRCSASERRTMTEPKTSVASQDLCFSIPSI